MLYVKHNYDTFIAYFTLVDLASMHAYQSSRRQMKCVLLLLAFQARFHACL
jgi:hypothetical protein